MSAILAVSKGVSKSGRVLFNGVEAVVVLTLIILKERRGVAIVHHICYRCPHSEDSYSIIYLGDSASYCWRECSLPQAAK